MNGRVVCDPEDRFTQEDVNHYLEDIHMVIGQASQMGQESLDRIERELVLNDLYYLGLFILGIQKLYSETVNGTEVFHPWLFNRCAEVQEDPDFHVDIWAREHFKSTIITLLKTVQDILRDPEVAFCIYSYNASIARKFVRQIREALENPRLRQLFPEIIPEDTKSGKYQTKDEYGNDQTKRFQWSDEYFTVKRKTGRKEPTCSGYGLVNAQPTGMHFDYLVYDDTVTPDSVKSQTQNDYTYEQWKMSLNTGAGENVKVRIIGTRYASRDAYFHILNPLYKEKNILGQSRYTLRSKPCMKEDGTTVLYTPEYLQNKKNTMVGFVWASQMMCDPRDSVAFRFQEEWLARRCRQQDIWERRDEFNWYILVDPANSKGKNSDFTAMAVVGAGSDRNYYFPDGVRQKLSATERIDKIFELVMRWTKSDGRMPVVVWEQSGLLSDMEHIRIAQKERDCWFVLKAATTKPRLFADQRMTGVPLKEARIQATEPLFRAMRIILAEDAMQSTAGRLENVYQTFIDDEYLNYPFVDHDDFFDALSRIADAETGPLITFPSKNPEVERTILRKKAQVATDVFYIDSYIPF